jgi:cytochrome c553
MKLIKSTMAIPGNDWVRSCTQCRGMESGEEVMDSSLWGAETTPRNERRGHRIMKVVSLQLALQLAILTIVFLATGRAEGPDTATVSKRQLEAKIGYCNDCHGSSAQGYRGFFPIPRLAGQQTEYLENQLGAFVERRRPNNIMSNVAHVLSPAMIRALAANFTNLNPKPLGGAPKKPVAAGKKIFEDGIPEANIVACAACHGPDAMGKEQIPRLAGQLYEYTFNKLTNWTKERGQDPAKPDTSAIMQPVVHSLTKAQIEAVAAYVSDLK